MTDLMSRMNYDAWTKAGKKRIDQVAEDKVSQRLAAYERPDIDPGIEKDLTAYVAAKKNG